MHITQLRDQEEELVRLNVKVVVVTFENDYLARCYVEDTSLSWPILIDDTREVYKRYGMLTASFWDVWGLKTWIVYIRELCKGNKPHKSDGDIYQRGGDVLIDPAGIVRLHHIGEGPADRPSVEHILNAASAHNNHKQGKLGRRDSLISMILLMLLFAFVIYAEISAAGESCQDCHGNFQQMSSLGRREFAYSANEIRSQTRMDATCSQCHLGSPSEKEKTAAHKGVLRPLVVSKKGLTPISSVRKTRLGFGSSQTNRVFATVEKDGKPVKDSQATALLWHDKSRDSLSQDFDVMQKTCGSCHRQEFDEFVRSTMARNAKQIQYGVWMDPKRGPHNCGAWFDGNFDSIQNNTMVAMSRESNVINQKACNTCHVGCLDCHYLPQQKNHADSSKGVHTFVKTPPAESCYGSGRASICHAGPEDRRRGAGYFGGSFSYPEGNEPDLHVKAKVGCLDCHESTKTNPKIGHAMIKRQAQDSCQRCHADVVTSHSLSMHRNLTCESCHIGRVAGYQATFWGPGTMAGTDTPYFKFKAYYGYMQEPVLIRDQKGHWIPVKPFPMAVMNQKNEPPFRPGLYWRYPADLPDLQRTDDAWGYAGISDVLPGNNRAMLWIQMDKMSHKLGKSRPCISCHSTADGSQLRTVTWEYNDPGAMPFNGSHQVRADSKGIFIEKMKSEPIQLENGYSLSAFAPWLYLGDSWKIQGDYSLPVLKAKALYDEACKDPALARKKRVVHN